MSSALEPGLGIYQRGLLALVGFSSVAPLLAWVSFEIPFHLVAAAFSLPLATCGAIYVVWASLKGKRQVRDLLHAAFAAGLVGTLLYDIFRVPFIALFGFRLLAPIESYGVLLLDAPTSSNLTDFAGWSYHFSNGFGFAITYVALFRGRHWLFGVAYGLVLETGTLVTSFAELYGVAGNWSVIAISYLAHVPYGAALGLMLQNPELTARRFRQLSRHVGPLAGILLFVGLSVWHKPWLIDSPATAQIQRGRLDPQWVRVQPGGCVAVSNRDAEDYTIQIDGEVVWVTLGNTISMACFDDIGVHRIRTTGDPFDGGFAIVDPALAREP